MKKMIIKIRKKNKFKLIIMNNSNQNKIKNFKVKI